MQLNETLDSDNSVNMVKKTKSCMRTLSSRVFLYSADDK